MLSTPPAVLIKYFPNSNNIITFKKKNLTNIIELFLVFLNSQVNSLYLTGNIQSLFLLN